MKHGDAFNHPGAALRGRRVCYRRGRRNATDTHARTHTHTQTHEYASGLQGSCFWRQQGQQTCNGGGNPSAVCHRSPKAARTFAVANPSVAAPELRPSTILPLCFIAEATQVRRAWEGPQAARAAAR